MPGNCEWACQKCDWRFGAVVPFGLRCCGLPVRAAYIKGMAGQMTVGDDYGHKPYSCRFLGKPLEQMSREELIGAVKLLGEQCTREREDALATIKAMRAFSLPV